LERNRNFGPIKYLTDIREKKRRMRIVEFIEREQFELGEMVRPDLTNDAALNNFEYRTVISEWKKK